MDAMTSFLRTIAEEPDDDTHRLVFSDWLDDHGQPERAEFIRLQVELARMDPGDECYAEKTARMRRCGVFTRPGTMPFFDHLPTAECKIGFQRGMIEFIDTWSAKAIDASGFDRIPLQTLRTDNNLIELFRRFAHLKRLEFGGDQRTPERLLEVLGPGGWFPRLEELSLPGMGGDVLAAGVIPRFDLPRLRNFYLFTVPFYNLGVPVAGASEEDYDFESGRRRPWGGLPGYLPANALPSARTLERFVWHSNDDCDFFNDEGWYWRGPAMESLLAQLRGRDLRQIEVAVDYDDHEGGSEGVIAAPHQRDPLELVPTLRQVTLDEDGLRQLAGSGRKLMGLRVYGDGLTRNLVDLLRQPVCSALESLQIESRFGSYGGSRDDGPRIEFPALKSLTLSGVSFEFFANCEFPALVSLRGVSSVAPVLNRKWPRLQHLACAFRSEGRPGLEDFVKSDGSPTLTTLTFGEYSSPTQADLSRLANCPHMPHLSLIRMGAWGIRYIVAGGQLTAVRGDIFLDEPIPTTPFRLRPAF